MHRPLAIAVALVVLTLGARVARAQVEAPRVFHVPTAWLQPEATVHGSAGAHHRGGGLLAVTAGLGGLADIEVSVSDRASATDDAAPLFGSALFKLGIGNGLGWRGPALALGVRRSFYAAANGRSARIAEAFVVGSAHAGPVTAHAGAQLTRAEYADGTGALDLTLRGFGGLEYRPAQYPKTTLLGDVAWAPALDDVIAQRWVAGWGIRYLALPWGSIELAVRHRETEAIGDATVFVRINGWRQP